MPEQNTLKPAEGQTRSASIDFAVRAQIGGKRKWVWIKPWGNDALTEDEMEELRERLTPSWAASAPRTPSTSTAGSRRIRQSRQLAISR